MILVDDLQEYPPEMTRKLPPRLRRARWCHMVSDTSEEELHAFAAKLGLERRWAQVRPKYKGPAHYDLIESRRAAAIEFGAIAVSARELVQRNFDGLTQRRLRGELPLAAPATEEP